MTGGKQKMEQELVSFEVGGIGLARLDVLHRKVIVLLTQLSECAEAQLVELGHRTDEFQRLLGDLSDTFLDQFRCESALHRAVAYPLAELHGRKHEALIQHVAHLRANLADQPSADLSAVTTCLMNGLDEHTFFWDTAYRDFLREARLQPAMAYEPVPATTPRGIAAPFRLLASSTGRHLGIALGHAH
jgi:hemerythrin